MTTECETLSRSSKALLVNIFIDIRRVVISIHSTVYTFYMRVCAVALTTPYLISNQSDLRFETQRRRSDRGRVCLYYFESHLQFTASYQKPEVGLSATRSRLYPHSMLYIMHLLTPSITLKLVVQNTCSNFHQFFCSQYIQTLLFTSWCRVSCQEAPPSPSSVSSPVAAGSKHDVEVMKWVLLLRYSLGLRPVEERGRGGEEGKRFFCISKTSGCLYISHYALLLSTHLTGVLFLVRFNNFGQTLGFYWSKSA